MIWAEKEVPSLELCRRLKELGFPQESSDSGWYWGIRNYQRELLFCNHSQVTLWIKYHQEELGYREIIKAPTLREILEWLPYFIEAESKILKRTTSYYLYFQKLGKDFYKVYYKWEYNEYYQIIPEGCIEADINNACVKMLIWLAENGYVKFKE